MRFSVIIPVYNRPDEAGELLESLAGQTFRDFEVIVVEDGSALPCKAAAERYAGALSIVYHAKPNTGRSDTRNTGMTLASGEYLLFFDSDCILPPRYFEMLVKNLADNYADCFGGPDAAHESFTPLQKAINYTMTSFFTTGGIRGGRRQLEKFKPRTFNMGFSREVYNRVGGFRDMFAEDIDLSIRIASAGFRTALYQDVWVYHKRRVSFRKFYRQVRNFGAGRIGLALLHKGSLKAVHTLPAVFVFAGAMIAGLSAACSPYWLVLPASYTLLLFGDAAIKTRSVRAALLSIAAAYIQIAGYGWGFISAAVQKIILRKNPNTSRALQKGYR